MKKQGERMSGRKERNVNTNNIERNEEQDSGRIRYKNCNETCSVLLCSGGQLTCCISHV